MNALRFIGAIVGNVFWGLLALSLVLIVYASIHDMNRAGKAQETQQAIAREDALCGSTGGYLLQGLPDRGGIRFCVYDAAPMPRLNLEFRATRVPALPPLPGEMK